MAEATLSRKNQIVIPKEVREALHANPGDKFIFVVRGNIVSMFLKPKNYAKAILGLARGLYPADYLEKERRDWDKEPYSPSCVRDPRPRTPPPTSA
jgi:AbrB family looped-hinge helix DNA binding protein